MDDIWPIIISYLDFTSVARLRETCKNMNCVVDIYECAYRKWISQSHIDMNMLMSFACESGKIDFLKLLIKKGGDIHNERKNRFLKNAIEGGHLDIVKYFVSLGIDIHDDNDDVFRWACFTNSIEIIQYLFIEIGNIDINVKEAGYNEFSALSNAIYGGHVEVIKYLLANGATVTKDSFESACSKGNMEIVTLLGDSQDTSQYEDAMICAFYDTMVNINKNTFPIVKYLVSKGHFVLPKHLEYASFHGNLEVVKYYYENFAFTQKEIASAVGNAMGQAKFKIVDYLVSKGSPISDDMMKTISEKYVYAKETRCSFEPDEPQIGP